MIAIDFSILDIQRIWIYIYIYIIFHGRLSVTLIFTLWSSSSSLNECRSIVTSRSIGIASKWCPFLLWLSCIQVLTRYGSDVSCITDVMRASLIYPTIAEAGVSLPQRFCQEKGNMAWPRSGDENPSPRIVEGFLHSVSLQYIILNFCWYL